MNDDEFVMVNEHEIGTCKMTQELEESFLKSCRHNNTTPEDLEYFRSYVWNLFAMLSNKLCEVDGRPQQKVDE